MEDLILAIVKPLVDHPDDVSLHAEETDSTYFYQLSVNKEDMGRVIGKQGRIAKAIRTLVYAAGQKADKKVRLEIID
ncbi:KH domain-containing protein [Listeria aquatica]|uniref:RNA-binding protein KhpA n=1 Tax=Listeria aquatica TaxID=1494960 RepID=A0A841ZN56_9LIST|nr:KH domain-containing protein [Listeria aquatica]MBC1522109.1 KH domain-containing protein [Listeria aquatica]